MATSHIAVVLAGLPPDLRDNVTALLKPELAEKLPGSALALADIPGGGPPGEIVKSILAALEKHGFFAREQEPVYTAEEEEKIRKRLEGLGYI